MTVSLHDLTELHDETGAGVDECRRVLDITDGDVDQARTILSGHAASFAEISRAAQAREAARHVIYLAGEHRVGVLPTDQAVLMLTLADELQARQNTMTQQADKLAMLLAFADRLRAAMAVAASSAVRLDVDPTEEEIATFLLAQARARAAVVDRTRFKHVCQTCGKATLSNPEYEKLMDHRRRGDAATRGLGVAVLTGGASSPVIMANSLFAFRSMKPDYHCPNCYGLDTDQSVVVFCPNCKALNDQPLLKLCKKCRYDFVKAVDLSDLWHAPDAVIVPAPAGDKVTDLQLDDTPTFLSFLPDGRHLISASCDRDVKMWDVSAPEQGARLLWTFEIGGAVKMSNPVVAVSPDGEWVAVAKPLTPRVRALRASDGTEVGGFVWAFSDGGTPNGLSFLPGSQSLVLSASYVEVWSYAGERQQRMKLGAITTPASVACSPDGMYIAAAAGSLSNNKLFVWSAKDGTQLARLSLHGSICDLAWSPSGTSLAVGIGSAAQVLSIPDGRLLHEYQLDAQVTDVDISPDGGYLAAASKDQSARVFDLRTNLEVAHISRPHAVTAVAFSPDGRLAIGDESNAVQLWSPPTRN